MEKFIPYEKLSKKKRKERDKIQRMEWGISPITRKGRNERVYNRKKTPHRSKDATDAGFCF